jgi:hypothetical protein
MMNSSYSQPDVLLEQMNPEGPDFDEGDGPDKFSRKNGKYPGDIEKIETDPYILSSQKVQPERAKTTTSNSSGSDSSDSSGSQETTDETSEGTGNAAGGGTEEDELSDSSLKKIGALSQIAPDIFGLAQQSGEPDYMPRTTNPRTEDALGTMDDAIDQMPDEYDIRDARMRNERAYHAGMDQMYRNSRSAAVARGNQANAYAQKMRGTNKLNVQKNNKEAQYAQAEAQLLSNKSQMEQQAGVREAKYSANYHRNKLKADAKQRAIRQRYLSNIGTKVAYNTRRELKERRDMDKIRINQGSHTQDVQMGLDKFIQLLEEDKKKNNSDG